MFDRHFSFGDRVRIAASAAVVLIIFVLCSIVLLSARGIARVRLIAH